MVDEDLIHLWEGLVDTLHQDIQPQMISLLKFESRTLNLEKQVDHLTPNNEIGKEEMHSTNPHLHGDASKNGNQASGF